MSAAVEQKERERRWRLALGDDDENSSLSTRDRRIDMALTALYGSPITVLRANGRVFVMADDLDLGAEGHDHDHDHS